MSAADSSFDTKVLDLICQAVPPKFRKASLSPSTRLQAELGIDSLALATMVFRLEEVFGISLTGIDLGDVDLGKLRTVDDALVLSRRIVERARAGG